MRKFKAILLLLFISVPIMAQWYDFVGNLQLDINLSANPDHVEGLLFYDNTENTVAYYNDDADVTVNIGQENLVRVRNTTGVSVSDGTPVFISGSTGQTPNISLANASFIETSITLGLWTSGTTANNAFGYVTTFGIVHDLNTAAFVEGTVLYLSTTDGVLTDALPIPPAQVYILGIVTNSHASQGKVFVRPEALTRDDSLHKNIITNFSGDAKFNPNLNKFTSGDSAIFGDSGTISGTLVSSTTASDLISGTRVWKYTQAAGSLDDWIGFPQATVPEIVNTTSVKLSYQFKYKYDGLLGDIETRVRCVDDSSLLISSSNSDAISPDLYKLSGEVTVPKDCNEIIVGVQVATLNNGAILLFDNIKVSDEPRETKNFTKTQESRFYGSVNEGSTRTRIAYFSDGVRSEQNAGLCYTFTNDSTNGLEVTMIKDCEIKMVFSVNDTGSTVGAFVTTGLSGGDFTTNPVSIDSAKVLGVGSGAAGTARGTNAVGIIKAKVGDKFYPHLSAAISTPSTRNTLTITATGLTAGTVFARDVSSTDIIAEGAGNGATVLTANVTNIDFTETVDSNSAWNGTQFTIPEDGIYNLSGSVALSATGTMILDLYVDAVQHQLIGITSGQTQHPFNVERKFFKDDVLSIRSRQGVTLSNNIIDHTISITKVAPKIDNFIVDLFDILTIKDGVTAPSAIVGKTQIYVDDADGDLKVIFGDGVIKTLATDI